MIRMILNFVRCFLLILAMISVATASAHAAKIHDVGAQRLTVNSALTQVRRLHHQLCDVLRYLDQLQAGGTDCPVKDAEPAESHDLTLRNDLFEVLDTDAAQAILAFQRMFEVFCEAEATTAEPSACWANIPKRLDAVRAASEKLYAEAAGAGGDASDDATRLVQQEGERALLSLVVLGRQWAQTQFIVAADGNEAKDARISCGVGRTLKEVPSEIEKAFRQLAAVGAGEKARRAIRFFDEIEAPITRAADAFAGGMDLEALDQLCALAAAADLRTNSRLERFLADPDRAVPALKEQAALVAQHRGRLCASGGDADAQGLCAPAAGDAAAVFSTYLRSAFRSWDKANELVGAALGSITIQAMQDQLAADTVEILKNARGGIHELPKPSMIIGNLLVELVKPEGAPTRPNEDVDVAMDSRSLAGQLSATLASLVDTAVSTDGGGTPDPAACKAVDVTVVLQNAAELSKQLTEKLKAVDDAVGDPSGSENPMTAEQKRGRLIEETKAFLGRAFSAEVRTKLNAALRELAKISDRLELEVLTGSDPALVLAATLRSFCASDKKIELAFSLELAAKRAEVQPEEEISGEEKVVSAALMSLPLRRSFVITFERDDFQSALEAGRIGSELVELFKAELPRDFTIDISGLCSLAVILGPATTQAETTCVWPSRLPLPAGAALKFDERFKRATISFPQWLAASMPAACPTELVLAADMEVKPLLDCLSADLERVLETMLGGGLRQLADEATTALSETISKQLKGDLALSACTAIVSPRIGGGAGGALATDIPSQIRRSIEIIDRPVVKTDAAPQPIPDELPVLEVSARLSFAACLNQKAANPDRRKLEGWRDVEAVWSRVLKVKLPRFKVENQITEDPLAVWDQALAALREARGHDILVLEEPQSEISGNVERSILATALLASQHFELCRSADGNGEQLLFWPKALNRDDMSKASCTMPEAGPGLVVAAGPDIRHLQPAGLDAALAGVAARIEGDVSIKLGGMQLVGAAPRPGPGVAACAANVNAENAVSFSLGNAGFTAAGSRHDLGDLTAIVAWGAGKPPSVSLTSEKPFELLQEAIATIAGPGLGGVQIHGLSVREGRAQPCIPGVDALAVAIGEDFFQQLLQSETVEALAKLANRASEIGSLLRFVHDGQPAGEFEKARAASKNLAVSLKACRPREASSGNFLNCDYEISLLGCTAQLRLDRDDYAGELTFDGDRLRLSRDCSPLGAVGMFGSEATDLPIRIAGLQLHIGDTVAIKGKLEVRSEGGKPDGVAIAACSKELGDVSVGFEVNVKGEVALQPEGIRKLSECAKAYATGRIAEELLPPDLKDDFEKLSERMRSVALEWLQTVGRTGLGKCETTSIAGWLEASCSQIGFAEAMLHDDWSKISGEWCRKLSEPIGVVLGSVDKVQESCRKALEIDCRAATSDPICDATVGAVYKVAVRLPFAGDQPIATAAARFSLPDKLAIEKCFGDGVTPIEIASKGFLRVSLRPKCEGDTIRLDGTVALSEAFPWDVPAAPIGIAFDLKSGKAVVEGGLPDWRDILAAALSKSIRGQTLGIEAVQIKVDDTTEAVQLDDRDRITVKGTLLLDWVERIEAPGFEITFDLRGGGVDLKPPSVLDRILADILQRTASAVSIPGALSVDIVEVKAGRNQMPESVTAKVTIDASMFKATMPPLTIDKSGVKFGKPFEITLQFEAEVPIPPVTLSKLRGTISEKALSVGADATLLQSSLAYVLKATGDFTIPFDHRDDIVAIEQMIAFTVVPLGKSTSRRSMSANRC